MTKDAAHRANGPTMAALSDKRQRTNLGKEAVKAALNGSWARAADLNRAILEMCPEDCEAANRLAKALMELGDYDEARRILEELRERAPGNNIARKNLARLEQMRRNGDVGVRAGGNEGELPRLFIAESGKACTTTLRDQARGSDVAAVGAGEQVVLSAWNEGVKVSARDGRHLGLVERRLGRRLNKLMAGGNEYTAVVVGAGPDGLSVIVRETRQHPALRHVVSFPSSMQESGAQPSAVPESPIAEPYYQDAHAIADTIAETAVEEDGEDEGAAIVIVDEVDGQSDDDPDDVPVLDTDADDGAATWPAFAPVSTDEDDWE